MTDIRLVAKNQTAIIKAPRILTLEESLEFLNGDEYMGVTPESVCLRKQTLDKNLHAKAAKKKKSAEEQDSPEDCFELELRNKKARKSVRLNQVSA